VTGAVPVLLSFAVALWIMRSLVQLWKESEPVGGDENQLWRVDAVVTAAVPLLRSFGFMGSLMKPWKESKPVTSDGHYRNQEGVILQPLDNHGAAEEERFGLLRDTTAMSENAGRAMRAARAAKAARVAKTDMDWVAY
jgi:hypothetical protein